MKNPKECVCIQQKQTFFILNELTAQEYRDGTLDGFWMRKVFQISGSISREPERWCRWRKSYGRWKGKPPGMKNRYGNQQAGTRNCTAGYPRRMPHPRSFKPAGKSGHASMRNGPLTVSGEGADTSGRMPSRRFFTRQITPWDMHFIWLAERNM